MINDTLIWFMLLPVLFGLGIWWFLGHTTEALMPAGAFVVVSCLVVGVAFFGSKSAATGDVEIWNGKITDKSRDHGSYVRTYQCNCREVCSGSGNNRSCSTTCDTCYEDRYTVTWRCGSTIGEFVIKHLDETSRSVYKTPDPKRYLDVIVGEPVARAMPYVNYVQAVPSSLFTPSAESLKQQFAALTPPYPIRVFDYYRINRFLSPGISVPDEKRWNEDISELLKNRGPDKQVNAIVVIAKTSDRNYVYALQDAWEGANKNDVVLVIGAENYPKIDFVDVISWTKNELFKVELRDAILAQGEVDRERVLSAVAAQIDKNFERRRMREFEYLEAEIDPPSWLLILLVTLMATAAVILTLVLKHQGYGRRYHRRF